MGTSKTNYNSILDNEWSGRDLYDVVTGLINISTTDDNKFIKDYWGEIVDEYTYQSPSKLIIDAKNPRMWLSDEQKSAMIKGYLPIKNRSGKWMKMPTSFKEKTNRDINLEKLRIMESALSLAAYNYWQKNPNKSSYKVQSELVEKTNKIPERIEERSTKNQDPDKYAWRRSVPNIDVYSWFTWSIGRLLKDVSPSFYKGLLKTSSAYHINNYINSKPTPKVVQILDKHSKITKLALDSGGAFVLEFGAMYLLRKAILNKINLNSISDFVNYSRDTFKSKSNIIDFRNEAKAHGLDNFYGSEEFPYLPVFINNKGEIDRSTKSSDLETLMYVNIDTGEVLEPREIPDIYSDALHDARMNESKFLNEKGFDIVNAVYDEIAKTDTPNKSKDYKVDAFGMDDYTYNLAKNRIDEIESEYKDTNDYGKRIKGYSDLAKWKPNTFDMFSKEIQKAVYDYNSSKGSNY